jgi:hypothetical protein
MKRLLKKLAAIVTIAAVTLTMAVAIPTPASADSIYDTAKAISSGKQVSTTLYSDGDEATYKVSVSRDGLLSINLTAKINYLFISVYDSNGNEVSIADNNLSSGHYVSVNDWYYWNDVVEQIKGTVSFQVSKGDYYIRFVKYLNSGNGKLTFTATYPSSTSTAKINYITINLPKGSTLSLGTDTTGSGTVTWKSSKTSVATVSSTGKVTAKAKGSTIITAKSGKSSKKIKIVVT